LKVVHVIEALGGGVYTYFKDLSYYFGNQEISKSIDTTIIYSGNRKEIDPKKIKEDFSNGINLIEVDMVKNLSPFKDIKSTIALYKKIKKINPDIIHLHSSKAGVLGRIAVFFLFKKKKVFYTPHGYSFLREDISKINKFLFWFIEKSFQMIFGGTTIACGDTEFEISKKIGKSLLVRNGINIEEIRNTIFENKNATLTIGIVARITFARNPKLFNEIALKNPNINFVWIGDGDMREYITAKNIRVTGWMLNRVAVLKELNNIDVYIQTSLWEGLPIAVLEAMAMEKPIIATNIIGNKDIVIHNETGFLFDNINELNEYFSILNCEKTRKVFGQKGLKRCQEFFDKDKNFNQLVALYNH
jgi:hypothetical protein